jgi:hypothetical protein
MRRCVEPNRFLGGRDVRLLAASLVALVAICGSAGADDPDVEPNNNTFEDSEEIPFTDSVLEFSGEIAPFADPADPADYFVITGLDPDSHYLTQLSTSSLALLHLDSTGNIVVWVADEFPMDLTNLRASELGQLHLAVCSLTEGDVGDREHACEVGATTTAPYDLTLEYIPEPGANALRLAALLCLAALARRRT